MSTFSSQDLWQRWLKWLLRLLALLLGAVNAWHARHTISPDGISYLDMSNAYLRGDWEMAVNGLWSPLYSWLLGLGSLVFRPSAYWKVACAHLVNFIIYVCALLCFEFLWREVVRQNRRSEEETARNCPAGLPVWAWMLLGYTLFVWTSLGLTTLAAVTPDLCVAALLFVAAGLALRIRRGAGGRMTFVLLGVTLGLGYLAKAAMLPAALLFLSVALFSGGSVRRSLPRALIALGVFVLVASLYFVPLSIKKGRLTFGESGRLNYAWYVNRVTLHVHWQGGDASAGRPQHPTRRLRDAPAVYEFRAPVKGTYPPWYDPSYWYEGVAPRFQWGNQIRVLRKNLGALSLILGTREQKIWWLGFLLLYLAGCRRPRDIFRLRRHWPLLVPAITTLAIFSLVHVEARYTGALVLLLWLGLFSGVAVRERRGWRLFVSSVVVALSLVMWRGLIEAELPAIRITYREASQRRELVPHAQWQVAEELRRIGLGRGDEVASIGYAFNALWAHLAGVRVVSEITTGSLEEPRPDAEEFWRSDAATRAEVLELLAATGARAVVANRVPEGAATSDWLRVGETGYYVYVLDRKLAEKLRGAAKEKQPHDSARGES